MKTSVERRSEFRWSKRRLLTVGTRFSASMGPVFRLSDGSTTPIRAPNPFTFRAHCKAGDVEWIEATDGNGAATVLHIKGERSPPVPEIIPRLYRLQKVIHTKRRKT
jgi:hypothetical protein